MQDIPCRCGHPETEHRDAFAREGICIPCCNMFAEQPYHLFKADNLRYLEQKVVEYER